MFDPAAIEAFRRHVETRTTLIAITYTFLGLVFSFVVAQAMFGRVTQLDWLGLAAVALLGAGLGYIVGAERAFALRLQAQMTLFQAHIEANTQPTTEFDSAPTRVNAPPKSLLLKAGLRLN